MLVYPNAILAPGPQAKQGYHAYPSPQNKEGFVLHSMVGDYPSAQARLMGNDRASWHFSVLRSGAVYQHYDPRAVCWHCGVVGDADSLTAAVGNVALIGIEHEGGPMGNVSEPLTRAQIDATVALQAWCYQVLPELKPPALRASHFEHNWLSATACPSNRIPWPEIISRLQEDDMTPEEKALLQDTANRVGDIYAKMYNIWGLDNEAVEFVRVLKDIQARVAALELAAGTGPRTVKLEGTLT